MGENVIGMVIFAIIGTNVSPIGGLRFRIGRRKQAEEKMIEQPRLVRADAQLAAVIRLTVPRDEIQRVMGPAISEVMATLVAQRIAPVGPVFAHHFRLDPSVFDFEVGLPVTRRIAASGRVVASQLPAGTLARTVYHGAYEGLGSAWGEFDAWMAAEGHAVAGDFWECYTQGPESGPDASTWRTELNRPLSGRGSRSVRRGARA